MAALIAYRNLIDRATLTDGGYGIDPNHPIENLQQRGLAQYCAASSGSTLVIDAAFDDYRTIHLVGILGVSGHINGGIAGIFRVYTSNDGLAWTQQAELTFVEVDPVIDSIPRNVFIAFPAGVSALHLRVEAGFSGIDGAAQIARLWVGPALALPDGIDAGWQMAFRDTGTLDATAGGQWVESPGTRTRVLHVPLEGARDTSVAWGFQDGDSVASGAESLFGLQMTAGLTGEVIALPRTSSTIWMRYAGVYGHVETSWSIGHIAGPCWGSTIQIAEER